MTKGRKYLVSKDPRSEKKVKKKSTFRQDKQIFSLKKFGPERNEKLLGNDPRIEARNINVSSKS